MDLMCTSAQKTESLHHARRCTHDGEDVMGHGEVLGGPKKNRLLRAHPADDVPRLPAQLEPRWKWELLAAPRSPAGPLFEVLATRSG